MDGNWWSSLEQQIESAPCFLGLICNFVILIWVLYMAICIMNFLFLVLYLGDLLVQDVLPSKSFFFFFFFVYTSNFFFPSLVAPWRGVAQAPGLSGLTPGPGLII
jgi:hypothetical protein